MQAALSSGRLRVVSQPDLRRQGGVDMPGLPGGMGPVRRTVGTAAFPLPQLVGVALHLHGEHVHALKAAEKILHPERAFAHHMIHDDPAPGLRAAATAAWKLSMSGRPVASSAASTDSCPPDAA